MAWTTSNIFQAWVLNPMLAEKASMPTGFAGYVADTINCALFGTLTPDRTAAVGSTGYNTGVWVTGSELTGGTDWVAGGRAVPATKSNTVSAGVATFTSTTNLTSVATATITAAFGCLIYDNTITAGTVAKQGICYLYFGGSQSVTSGSFSVNWNASGIFTITV